MSPPVLIVCVGKQRRLVEGEAGRYLDLLRPYADVRVSCLKPVAGGREAAGAARSKESLLMRSRWSDRAYPVALSEKGTMHDSRSFASWVDRRVRSGDELTLNIGGAYGLADEIERDCRESLSLSRLTLPHRLCLTVLLEQLYRAFTILSGHPYHK